MTVVTGVSGSGKTSLAFDTLFAEGQRRYVESLSTYARRFLGRLSRAPVDSAEGLAPAIAIDQRNRSHNPRSTVATVTEIYDTLRLLYARIGRPHCPHCDTPLHSDSPSDAARNLQNTDPGAGWLVCSLPQGVDAKDLISDGYTRAWNPSVKGTDRKNAEVMLEPDTDMAGLQLVVDRFNPGTTERDRIADSVVLAYGYGAKRATFIPKNGEAVPLALAAECSIHGTILPDEITPRHFSFNSHTGACPGCDGLGKRAEIDPKLVLPKPHRNLRDALDKRVASVVFRSKPMKAMLAQLYKKFGTTQDTPFEELTPQLQKDLLYGHGAPLDIRWTKKWGRSVTRVNESRAWPGIIATVNGWKGRDNWIGDETTCSVCNGGRLKAEFRAVRIDTQGIHSVCAMTVEQAQQFWSSLRLTEHDETIAEQAIVELRAKLGFLLDVGLGYLTLDRSADTLSGGEAQRIRLATQLGARLTGTIYVLDEPTVGLHQRDTERLLGTLKELRDLGNTLVVVEHDP
ncbi:MAG: excinuclease ABC subunit A, partial [Myxococcota bacterium]